MDIGTGIEDEKKKERKKRRRLESQKDGRKMAREREL